MKHCQLYCEGETVYVTVTGGEKASVGSKSGYMCRGVYRRVVKCGMCLP